MLFNSKNINSSLNTNYQKNKSVHEIQSLSYLSKTECNTYKNNKIINFIKKNKNNNKRIYIKSKEFPMLNSLNKNSMLKIERIYLKEISLDKLCFLKKIVILIRYLSLIEYKHQDNVDFDFSDIIINGKFELSLDINVLNDINKSNKIILNDDLLNNKVSKHIKYFIEMLKKMFPFLKLILFKLDDFFTDFKSNIYEILSKLLMQILFLSIHIDKNLLNLDISNKFLDGEKENYYFLTEIQNLLKNYLNYTKTTQNIVVKNISEYFIQNKKKKDEFIVVNEMSFKIKALSNQFEGRIVKEISFVMGKMNLNEFNRNSRKKKNIGNYSLDFKNKDSSENNTYKLKTSIINLDDIFPNITLTEESINKIRYKNSIKEYRNIHSNLTKQKKILIKEADQEKKNEGSNRLNTEILPEITNLVYNNVSLDFSQPKTNFNFLNLNPNHLINFKKNIIIKKKVDLKSPNISLNPKNNINLSQIRLNSGIKNIRKILNEYSNYNKDYIARIMSPKSPKSKDYSNFF